VEVELQILRDRSRVLLEEAEAKVEQLQAALRQQHGRGAVSGALSSASAIPYEAGSSTRGVKAPASSLVYGGGALLPQPSSSASLLQSVSTSSADQNHLVAALKKQVSGHMVAALKKQVIGQFSMSWMRSDSNQGSCQCYG
jgi:hypothetical protein